MVYMLTYKHLTLQVLYVMCRVCCVPKVEACVCFTLCEKGSLILILMRSLQVLSGIMQKNLSHEIFSRRSVCSFVFFFFFLRSSLVKIAYKQ